MVISRNESKHALEREPSMKSVNPPTETVTPSIQLAETLETVKDRRGRPSLAIRSKLGMNRETFARLVPLSTRQLASIEQGEPPRHAIRTRLAEIGRLTDALSEVIESSAVGPWLARPNEAFGGLKPMELIERGESDRIWEMIFALRSGMVY